MKRRRGKVLLILLPMLAAAVITAADVEVMDLLSLGRMNDAIRVLSNRDDPESIHLLSRAYYSEERWDGSVKYGEQAASLQPENAGYHLWLAREYGRKAGAANPMLAAGLARKAKNEFERAVQLDPANVQARIDLAQYYTEAPAVMGGGLDKARIQAAQVAKYDPANAHLVLARVATKQKHFPDAENQLRQAIEAAKSPGEFWVELAALYRLNGRSDDMEASVAKAVAQPNVPDEVYYRAAQELYLGGRDFPAAIRYLQRYVTSREPVESAPVFRAHYLLGQIYQKMGQNSAARTEYEASLALASEFDPARQALSRLK